MHYIYVLSHLRSTVLVHPVCFILGSVLSKNLQCHLLHSCIFCDLVIRTLLFCK